MAKLGDILQKGREILTKIAKEDLELFFEKMNETSPPLERSTYRKRIDSFDWDSFSTDFVSEGAKDYGPEDFYCLWMTLSLNIRNYRNLYDVVQEVRNTYKLHPKRLISQLTEKLPGFPKKPIGYNNPHALYAINLYNKQEEKPNYIIFYNQKREEYEKLPDREKLKWKAKATKVKEEYDLKLKEFYEENPSYKIEKIPTKRKRKSKSGDVDEDEPSEKMDKKEHPFIHSLPKPIPPVKLFFESRINKENPDDVDLAAFKNKLYDKYKKMKIEKKYKWLDKSMQLSMEYAKQLDEFKRKHPKVEVKPYKIFKILSNEDSALWELYNGKPEKFPTTCFDLYLKQFTPPENVTTEEEKRKLADKAWKNLDWHDQKCYELEYKKNQLEYKKEIKAYILSLPEILQEEAISNLPKKYQDFIKSVDKVPTKAKTRELIIPKDTSKNKKSKGKKGTQSAQYVEDDSSNSNLIVEEYFVKDDDYDDTFHAEEEHEPEEILGLGHGDDEEEEEEESLLLKKKKKKKRKKNKSSMDDDSLETEEDETNNHVNHQIIKNIKNEKASPSKRKEPENNDAERKKRIRGPKKPDFKTFKPENFDPVRNQRELGEVIRGIFDARQFIGRQFSVFYFYAKYAAKDFVWKNKLKADGLLETAKLIFQTFLELPETQKKPFIDQSYNLYLEKKHGVKLKNERETFNPFIPEPNMSRYPGEPYPPPKNPEYLYKYEMRKVNATDFKPWVELDEKLQFGYIKKLYTISNDYLLRFEDFIMNLNTNELIEYLVIKSRYWEESYLTKVNSSMAIKGFIFPFPTLEEKSEIIDEDERRERKKEQMRHHKKRDHNSLANDDLINKITDIIMDKEKTPPDNDENANPSSSNDITGQNSSKIGKNKNVREKQNDPEIEVKYTKKGNKRRIQTPRRRPISKPFISDNEGTDSSD